ncbi:hypothetical protein ACOMHN_055809 [Nucella lapillus]
MELQTTSSSSSNEDIPNDPGKMFIGGLSWQTSPVANKAKWMRVKNYHPCVTASPIIIIITPIIITTSRLSTSDFTEKPRVADDPK